MKWENRAIRNMFCMACCVIVVAGSRACYVSGETPDSLQKPTAKDFSYPDRIEFPKDIVCSKRTRSIDGQPMVVFPLATYSMFHYDGWQLYLKRLGHEGNAIDMPWKAPIFPTTPANELQGMQAGFEECRQRAQALLAQNSESVVRNMARRDYFDSLPPAPK